MNLSLSIVLYSQSQPVFVQKALHVIVAFLGVIPVVEMGYKDLEVIMMRYIRSITAIDTPDAPRRRSYFPFEPCLRTFRIFSTS